MDQPLSLTCSCGRGHFNVSACMKINLICTYYKEKATAVSYERDKHSHLYQLLNERQNLKKTLSVKEKNFHKAYYLCDTSFLSQTNYSKIVYIGPLVVQRVDSAAHWI